MNALINQSPEGVRTTVNNVVCDRTLLSRYCNFFQETFIYHTFAHSKQKEERTSRQFHRTKTAILEITSFLFGLLGCLDDLLSLDLLPQPGLSCVQEHT